MKNKTVRYKEFALLCSAVCLSTGFINENPEAEVTKFINETTETVKPNPNLDLGPLPANKEYSPYIYKAESEDPFALKPFVVDAKLPEPETQNDCADEDCGDGAPVPHVKYFLENYELSQLWMVGTVMNKDQRRAALIQTPDAGVVNTVQGEYIGRNNGLIIAIKPDHVMVREKFKVPRGWQNRMAILELFNY